MAAERKRALRMLAELRRVGAVGPIRDLLHGKELQSARSWDDLEIRLGEYLGAGISYDDVVDVFERIRLHTWKSHFFFEMSTKDRDACLKVIDPDDSPFLEDFPAPLATSDLRKQGIATRPPTFVRCTEGEGGQVSFVFCSAREHVEREELSEEAIAPEYLERYPGATFYAEKPQFFQAYDSVHISPNERTIRLSIDASGRGVPVHAENVAKAFREIVGLKPAAFAKPVELFPAIASLYDDKQEGRVCEIHFDCPTQAVRRETLRRDRQDLRSELFHRAGRMAVKNISPYRIAVIWQRSKVEVEAYLPGSHRMLNSERGLFHCSVPGFLDADDIAFALRRVKHHARR